jgi:hypothetical protein
VTTVALVPEAFGDAVDHHFQRPEKSKRGRILGHHFSYRTVR